MTLKKVFNKSKLDLEMLLGIPEYKVFLDTKKAIMIVHSFSQSDEWFNDFSDFVILLNPKIKTPVVNEIYNCGVLTSGIELHFGWIKGDKKYLSK